MFVKVPLRENLASAPPKSGTSGVAPASRPVQYAEMDGRILVSVMVGGAIILVLAFQALNQFT